jgi:polysaccharide export outer membrane protein
MKKKIRILIFLILFFWLIPSNLTNRLLVIDLFCQRKCVDSFISIAWAEDSDTDEKPKSDKVRVLYFSEDYIIGAGDILEVFVYRNEQLSREVIVRPDGKISLPLVQDIRADGFTAVQIKNKITRGLRPHLDNPRVSVIVKAINSYKVSVLGRVRNPGVYPITGKTTIAEVVALAGGFTEWANKKKITVVTHENGEETKLTVNYKKIVSGKDPSENIILKRGDIIIVD